MAITSLETLEAVPIGTVVRYGEQDFKHHSEGWWCPPDQDEPVIRTRHFIGAVNTGAVYTLDDAPSRVGEVFESDRCWSILTKVENGEHTYARVWREGAGAPDGTWRDTVVRTGREATDFNHRFRMEQQPPAFMVAFLLTALERNQAEVEARTQWENNFNTEHARARELELTHARARRDLELELAASRVVRDHLRAWVNG